MTVRSERASGGKPHFPFKFDHCGRRWHKRLPSNGRRWTTNQQSATVPMPHSLIHNGLMVGDFERGGLENLHPVSPAAVSHD
jgi:hypothetical protein